MGAFRFSAMGKILVGDEVPPAILLERRIPQGCRNCIASPFDLIYNSLVKCLNLILTLVLAAS